MSYISELGERAKKAKGVLASSSGETRNRALYEIAKALRDNAEKIIEANGIDVEKGKENGLSASLIDRLSLDKGRIEGMAKGAEDIAALADPIGRAVGGTTRPNGLRIEKVSVPLGVIGVIYEARPNVTADAAALCVKSGNAVILRGGKEAINSNLAIAGIMREAVRKAGLPEDVICFVEDTSREGAKELMRLNRYIDVLIPRGGAGLIRSVVENSSVPVIETGAGNCHIYIDETADAKIAADIVFNAKTSRPSVCNACESLVIHSGALERVLPLVCEKLREGNVEIRGDERAAGAVEGIIPATEEDWGKEYLDYIISVKTVDSVEEAIEHINRYSTGHSESIITKDFDSAMKFQQQVDSAAVYVNASTRFTDGGEFGFGAEIGISTQKLHARGPLGLSELTSQKYIISGSGQIR